MAKSGAESLSEKEFLDEVVGRLDGAVDGKTVRLVVRALKEEAIDCLVHGYKVGLNGLVRLEPRYVPGKPKGELVRNPFTGETSKREKAVPANFKAKATASSKIKAAFPSVRTKDGKALAEQLQA